jgi:hypothetical protein
MNDKATNVHIFFHFEKESRVWQPFVSFIIHRKSTPETLYRVKWGM